MAEPIYGPHNPHPLSQMRTELVWEGKYDEYGNRREVDVAGLAMPLQKIETIDQPRAEAAEAGEQQLLAFEKKSPRRDDFRNRLIWGDNKLVMASLMAEFKGKIDLIYIDPPFDVGADFTMEVPIGDSDEAVEKDQSLMEMVAYRDTWGKDVNSYLFMIYESLTLMRELLAERGSVLVHCDWHVNFQVRSVLNEVFAQENFRNEIIWYYYNKMQGNVNRFAANHDTILWYSKSGSFFFEQQNEKRDKPVQQLKRVWDKESGRLVNAKNEDGSVIYIEADDRTVDDVWRIAMLQPADKTEYLGYATQKPLELVGRIIDAASRPGDLVLDAFCGSGTSLAAAEGLRTRRVGGKKEFYYSEPRRWVGVDLGRYSVHTSRKRLIELQRNLHAEAKPYRAFDVYNLGRYERQWWQKERLKGADEEHRRVVLEFFKAEQLTKAPSPLIHGRKNGAFVHVDSIDSIFTRTEAKALVQAVAAAGGTQVYALAWEFEMDLRLALAALEQEFGVKVKPVYIPREIMEKNLKGTPPFFEMAVVEAQPIVRDRKERTVDIKLSKFLPSLAEVPTKELDAIRERAMRSGMDFIDFWAIDFDWSAGKPFNHDWQDYRTRKDRSLKTVSDASHQYPKKGKYTACVKVVDTFGSDTSITVAVEV